MKIKDIEIKRLRIPLIKPFKTALRTCTMAEEVVVLVKTDTGEIGIGEAPPTAVITGDTNESVIGVIENVMKKSIIGHEISNIEGIMDKINSAAVRNTSAKAAVDMAIYDLFGKYHNAPLYKLLGGYREKVSSDITISINEVEEMQQDAVRAIKQGFDTLKIKVGKDAIEKDIARIKGIREVVGRDVAIRLDANQGWTAKNAIRSIRKLEDMDLDIQLVEQPVKAWDIDGLKYVTDNVTTNILADESVFTYVDAFNVLSKRAADLINIKLMKCGGIHNALKINAMAESCGIECMIGCMIESKISISAAVHLACGKKNITMYDLDAPFLLSNDPTIGGVNLDKTVLSVTNKPGLGIERVEGLIDI